MLDRKLVQRYAEDITLLLANTPQITPDGSAEESSVLAGHRETLANVVDGLRNYFCSFFPAEATIAWYSDSIGIVYDKSISVYFYDASKRFDCTPCHEGLHATLDSFDVHDLLYVSLVLAAMRSGKEQTFETFLGVVTLPVDQQNTVLELWLRDPNISYTLPILTTLGLAT